MKVNFITREGFNGPGGRIRCWYFSRELQKYGVETEILSYPEIFGAKEGKQEIELRIRDKIKYNLLAARRLIKEKSSIFYLQRVHYHSLAPWVVAKLFSHKLILDLDDWEWKENPRYVWGFYPTSKTEFLLRNIAKSATIGIAASRSLQSFLSRYMKEVYWLPSGVDCNLFKPPQAAATNENSVIFSWVGTVHRPDNVENIEFLMECFSQLVGKYPFCRLEIVGDGIYGDQARRIISQRKLEQIEFKGWLDPLSMPAYLAGIDVGLLPLIQPTKFNQAKSPVKLFEYMAMGKPTVASDCGEIKYIIKEGINGLLAENKKEFIEKMEVLIANNELRHKIGEKARVTVQQEYSLQVLGDKLYKILQAIEKRKL